MIKKDSKLTIENTKIQTATEKELKNPLRKIIIKITLLQVLMILPFMYMELLRLMQVLVLKMNSHQILLKLFRPQTIVGLKQINSSSIGLKSEILTRFLNGTKSSKNATSGSALVARIAAVGDVVSFDFAFESSITISLRLFLCFIQWRGVHTAG